MWTLRSNFQNQRGKAVWRGVIRQWQQHWDSETKGRYLYKIQNKVGTVRNSGTDRREQVIISRLFTNCYFLNIFPETQSF
uniref:Uncharacterized protein n=1 Tax=Anguilla anguilla TaxID=7936 RepID=A0A0E9XUB5_ANGAN